MMENNSFIDPASVRYLVFEGGGGKGFAYLGALQAFQHPDVGILKEHYPGAGYQIDPTRIDGVAGASAGAIFAALVGCGIRYETLENIMRQNKLDDALNMDSKEEETEYRIPYPQGNNGFVSVSKKESFLTVIQKINNIRRVARLPALYNVRKYLIDEMLARTLEWVNEHYESIQAVAPYFGMHSAYNLRLYVNDLIREALMQYEAAVSLSTGVRKSDTPSIGSITFKMHYEIMKLPLSIAGFNAEKGELVYFNYKTAPEMAIADAVRISMSIPLYFMPVYIAKLPDITQEPHATITTGSSFSEAEKEKLRGIWVDGGTRANLPVEAFDELVDEDKAIVKTKMLLLRLSKSGYTNYSNVFNYLLEQVFILISNTSTIYIRKHNLSKRVIEMETGNLSMLKFKVDWQNISKLKEINTQKILKQFQL